MPAAPYPYDRAVNFSSTGYLTKATTSSLGLTNFTVEAWIYPTSFNNYAGIIAKQDFQLMTATNGALAFMIERSWSWELRTSATNVLTLNKWQHVAASYNASTKQMKMYVDGVLVDTLPVAFGNAASRILGWGQNEMEDWSDVVVEVDGQLWRYRKLGQDDWEQLLWGQFGWHWDDSVGYDTVCERVLTADAVFVCHVV